MPTPPGERERERERERESLLGENVETVDVAGYMSWPVIT
jgi:hypothetical protein